LISKFLSWDKSLRVLIRLQIRLLKASYVADIFMIRQLQKLLLNSNASRLLAIRQVTQISLERKISGVDGKTFLSFIERFELNEFLKVNYKNWIPNSFKKVALISKTGKENIVYISTVSDRVWQLLIKFSLDPVHEALFHPNNLGSRLNTPFYKVQKLLLMNLSFQAFPFQKRFAILDLNYIFSFFDQHYLLAKIKVFKRIKVGIFRLLKKGFRLEYSINYLVNLSDLLLNILLDGIEDTANLIHHTSYLFLFINPIENEKVIINSIFRFFLLLGNDCSKIKVSFISAVSNFDFLEWHFKFSAFNNSFVSTPSLDNYNKFLKRVKLIINNSNYGVNVKVQKLSPIIKEWKQYHKFSNLQLSQFKLFSIKKRTLNIFNKESKQDFYSSKRLVEKCFFYSNYFEQSIFEKEVKKATPFFGHFVFCIDSYKFLCVHCGVDFIFS
jgi:hypothetical protein